MNIIQVKIQHYGRITGYALLSLHLIWTLFALSIALSKGIDSAWWPAFFIIDVPASIPVFQLSKHVNELGWRLEFTLFALVGSLWQFYWPQALAWLLAKFVSKFSKLRGSSWSA